MSPPDPNSTSISLSPPASSQSQTSTSQSISAQRSASSTPNARLQHISAHMAPPGKASVFTTDVVPQAPEDPLFGLMAAYKKDTFDKKVDLGIGAYRDNDAKPWVLPVVKKVLFSN